MMRLLLRDLVAVVRAIPSLFEERVERMASDLRSAHGRRKYPPREAWVVLIDESGRELSERRPVVVDCDPLEFTVTHNLDFDHLQPGVASAVRVIDAEGRKRDVPL